MDERLAVMKLTFRARSLASRLFEIERAMAAGAAPPRDLDKLLKDSRTALAEARAAAASVRLEGDVARARQRFLAR